MECQDNKQLIYACGEDNIQRYKKEEQNNITGECKTKHLSHIVISFGIEEVINSGYDDCPYKCAYERDDN